MKDFICDELINIMSECVGLQDKIDYALTIRANLLKRKNLSEELIESFKSFRDNLVAVNISLRDLTKQINEKHEVIINIIAQFRKEINDFINAFNRLVDLKNDVDINKKIISVTSIVESLKSLKDCYSRLIRYCNIE